MRHRNHRHTLGVKKEHRSALLASLAASLFVHGKIRTTLSKARALRPFSEKIITLAKKAALSDDKAVKIHCRRLAVARVRDEAAIKTLFSERATGFLRRKGGYTRIYKLGQRIGDAAETALIELVGEHDEGYKKTVKKPAVKKVKKAKADAPAPAPAAEPAA